MNRQILKNPAMLICFVGLMGFAHAAEEPDALRITSFRNGELVWTRNAPETYYYQIEWSSPVTGITNWHSSYESLTDIRPDAGLHAVTSAVPMFYRVVATPEPVGLFTLSVLDGTGGGSYRYGEGVEIEANAPALFKTFDRWTGDTAHVANVSNANTTIAVLANVAVMATYRDELFALGVENGLGDGSYACGQLVRIAADDPPPQFKVFDRWTGSTGAVANVSAANTTLTMPCTNVSVTASYRDELFMLRVNSGSGGGNSYTNGEAVGIKANAPASYTTFDRWTGDTQNVANVWATNTTVTIRGTNVAVTATYVDVRYTLSVDGGLGGGSYTRGQAVLIAAANPPPQFKAFDRWTGDIQNVANVTAANTTLTMPGTNAAVTATYRDETFTLSVYDGTGGGSCTNGQVKQIAARSPAPYFRVFDRWTGATQTVANVTNANTTIRIQGASVAVTATYFAAPVAKILPADSSSPGVPWPNPRFTIGAGVSSNCVTDNLTGLMWLRNPEEIARTYLGAQSYCELMNVTTNGGYADWRLPVVKELLSLADYRYFLPCLPNTSGAGQMSNGQPFLNINSFGYWWSNTPNLKGYLYVWGFYVYDGSNLAMDKSKPICFTWPVRGGQ